MLAHGDYLLEWSGDILHSTPTGNFNEQGIHAYTKALHLKVASHRGWVLYLHLGAAPGLTPEALETLIITYQGLDRFGCIAIAAEVSPMWSGFLDAQLFAHLELPTLESVDPETLERFITDRLSHCDKEIEF